MTPTGPHPCRPHTSWRRVRAVIVGAALALGGCNIRELANSLAQTIIPVDDGGADAGAGLNEASLEGRPLVEFVDWPDHAQRACTRRGRLCVQASDSAATDALVTVAERIELTLDGLDISMQSALFSAGPVTFVLTREGGARSLGKNVRLLGPRVAVPISPRDGTEADLLARLLELRVLQRNPAVSATDATSLARALALRLGLARAPVDAATELAVIGANHGDRSGSDGRFLAWLDERLAPESGALLGATLSKAWRGDDGSRWRTAGDPWFVLLRNFSGESESGPKLDELILRHAVEVSSTLDGRSTLPFRWDEALPSKARRLLSVRAVEPTGIAWMRFERDAAHPSTTLVIAADWEEHARFRFFAQLLDREGKVVRTHRFAVPQRAPHVETTLEALDGVTSIVIGAINLGDPAAPFDPREGPWEPHAFLLTIAPVDSDGGFL